MKKKRITSKIALRFAVVIILLVFLSPIVWMFISSLKTDVLFYSKKLVLFYWPTVTRYQKLLVEPAFVAYVRNSLIVASVTTLLTVAVSSLAGYVFARFKFKGNKAMQFWVLSQRMFSPITIAIPLYIIMRQFRLLDSHLALILAYTTFNVPLAVWMIKEFFQDLPIEIEEAALVDGCSTLQVYFKIALPLALPGVLATTVVCFIFSWNEFLFALILTNSTESQTLPVAMQLFIGVLNVRFADAFATASIICTPVFALVLWIQRHLVKGLSLGAVRG